MGKRVMIIENETSIIVFLSELLSEEGYEVTTALNGVEGIRLLQTTPIDIAIVDLNMPVIGGMDVIDFMRKDPRLEKVPVIIITGNMECTEDRSENNSYQALIYKPFEIEDILQKVEALTFGL